MNKPTPITKEYVEYLDTLPEEELVQLSKGFSLVEKLEISSIIEGKPVKVPKLIRFFFCGFAFTIGLAATSRNNIFIGRTPKFENIRRRSFIEIRLKRFLIEFGPAEDYKERIQILNKLSN